MFRIVLPCLVAASFAACDFMEPRMVATCEKVLQDYWIPGASYERTGYTKSSRFMSRDEYRRFVDNGAVSDDYVERMLAAYDSGQHHPTRFSVRLDYRADGRSERAECLYESALDRWPDPGVDAVALYFKEG